MQILSVTLTNFKSHTDRHFVFQPGVNAISGENGAGKTSILEAIAWTLFNYRGGYTTEDLIRNGATSAQVQVEFVSSRDHRTYVVSRCTRSGYTIYDPQLGEKLDYTRIEEEVLPWLREHLGVARGTDLGKLFASTIGVPQGTFTVDFLLSKENRKPIFDKVLKVEEYQQTWKKMGDLEKFSRVQVESLERDVAKYDEDLEQLEPLKQQRQRQQETVQTTQAALKQVQERLAQLQSDYDRLNAQATQMTALERTLQQLQAEIDAETRAQGRLQSELEQAEVAAKICTDRREAFQAFTQAEQTLQALEQERQTEQQLQQQQRQRERQLNERQTQLVTLTHQLDRLTVAETEIARLEPLIQQQTELVEQQQAIAQQLQHFAALRQTIAVQERQRSQLQTRAQQLEQTINRLQGLELSIQEIPMLEQHQQRLQDQLSRVTAAAQFEADLRQIFANAQADRDRYRLEAAQAEATLQSLQQAVPPWSETLATILLTLQSGSHWQKSVMDALQNILDDLAEQTSLSSLEQHLQQVRRELEAARQHQAEFANLDRLLAQQQEVQQETELLEQAILQSQNQLVTEPELEAQQIPLRERLTELDDPRGRKRLLQQELQQRDALQTKLAAEQAKLAELQQAIATLETELKRYADLSERIQAQQQLKNQHREAYQEYLAHRELANLRKQRQQQLDTVTEQRQRLIEQRQAALLERDRLAETFDAAQFQTVQAECQQAREQAIALDARLPGERQVLEQLDNQLERLLTIQARRQEAQKTLERKRAIEKFVKFARKAYKEAGPRITERYIESISREADRLFRELLNRPNVALEWTRDYEIQVQEGSHSRRLLNLSGGEQMCAALAVRLALLRVLADIDIAFFDEPTTNMDRPRREQLAEAIANIKTFKQVFVISHDDTFEQVTENVILVERE